MSLIQFNRVYFQYDLSSTPVFNNLSISIDTAWKTGIIGRNGEGKTTLLNLVMRKIVPTKGKINIPMKTEYFPYEPKQTLKVTLDVIKDNIAPFYQWEEQMRQLLNNSDAKSLERYGEILEKYQDAGGYEIDALIEKEMNMMKMNSELLNRDFNTLSEGERTRVLIISLFLKRGYFLLIDEPTNHLDLEGRKLLGEYLIQKSGFILVTHDRYLLDLCVNHILFINKKNIYIEKGNFSSWKHNRDIRKEFEKRKRKNLQKEIKFLKIAATKRRNWANNREADKKAKTDQKEKVDKGFVGHRAAKSMKRALNIEKRTETKIEERKYLLNDFDKERRLKLDISADSPPNILRLDHIFVSIKGKTIIEDFSLVMGKGDRIAIVGKNGSGKTTLLNTISGGVEIQQGKIYKPERLIITRAYQNPLWNNGMLREHLIECDMDETRFRNILGSLGVSGEVFDRPLETFSEGERKKVDLCRSFLTASDLLLWDEPLNYIDLITREQLEDVILQYKPTLLFVEHDKHFVDRIATKVVYL